MMFCLSKLKATPSFCFAFKIPDVVAASNIYINFYVAQCRNKVAIKEVCACTFYYSFKIVIWPIFLSPIKFSEKKGPLVCNRQNYEEVFSNYVLPKNPLFTRGCASSFQSIYQF